MREIPSKISPLILIIFEWVGEGTLVLVFEVRSILVYWKFFEYEVNITVSKESFDFSVSTGRGKYMTFLYPNPVLQMKHSF